MEVEVEVWVTVGTKPELEATAGSTVALKVQAVGETRMEVVWV